MGRRAEGGGAVAGEQVASVKAHVLVAAGQFFHCCSLLGRGNVLVDHGQKAGQGPGRQLPADEAALPVGAADVEQAVAQEGEDLGVRVGASAGPQGRGGAGARGLLCVVLLRVLRGVLQAVMQATLMVTLQVVLQGFSQDDTFTNDVQLQVAGPTWKGREGTFLQGGSDAKELTQHGPEPGREVLAVVGGGEQGTMPAARAQEELSQLLGWDGVGAPERGHLGEHLGDGGGDIAACDEGRVQDEAERAP